MQWHETDLIVEGLEENSGDIEVEELTTSELYDLILDLQDFSDDPDNADERNLAKILEAWIDYRKDN